MQDAAPSLGSPWLKAAIKELNSNNNMGSIVGNVYGNAFQMYKYHKLVLRHATQVCDEHETFRICETGFNGGHSAVVFLHAAIESGACAKIEYVGFDIGQIPAAHFVATWMQNQPQYAHRFRMVWGDSKETGVAFMESGTVCDVVSVDGEHTEEGVFSDLTNLLPNARTGSLVLIDDCAYPNVGMVRAYEKFIASGSVKDSRRYVNTNTGSPGWCAGQKLA